ncbi:MAG: DUF177 domain-containing protein [Roseiflexus sp.]|nr:DUF177 domain-containing protein [Roseiflexus sp.]MBO9334513.1 DUF177 domain-containing protein [Roseiflexus sp.]MBO9364853.1 DUF177 domain-containing protein [Roseiflexus sp.]MBO9381105.1 DUF177 domain-containing protein [Roseiflexus sp.]MBO9388305.1 DUF177 domain-containing protein [Roseiflexus sp.]
MHMSKPTTNLKFNVAQLLREYVGGSRQYDFVESVLRLDDVLEMHDIVGEVRFTRTTSGVLVDVHARGTVEMECVRCLNPAVQHVEVRFRDEFHSRIDVTTGTPLPQPDEEDPFYLDELHMADVGEMLREYVLLELPMQPLCRSDCRGLCPECGADLNVEQCSCSSTSVDERFATLRTLLRPE